MTSPLSFRCRELDSLVAPISHPRGQKATGIALNVQAQARSDTRVAGLRESSPLVVLEPVVDTDGTIRVRGAAGSTVEEGFGAILSVCASSE